MFSPEVGLKQSENKIKEKLGRIVHVLALSALSFFSLQNKANAQITPYLDSLTMEMINPSCDLNPEQYKNIRAEAIKQRNWMLSYVDSVKYLERLTFEYKNWEKMGFSNEKSEFNNMAEFQRVIKDDSPDSIVLHDLLNNRKVIKTQDKIITNDFLVENPLSSIFPRISLSGVTAGDIDNIAEIRRQRRENLKNNPWMIVDTLGLENGSTVDGRYYPEDSKDSLEGISLAGFSLIRVGAESTIHGIVAHEEGHKITQGDLMLIPFTKFLLMNRAGGTSEYLKDPTEICARIMVLRYLLWEEGIYDASSQDFEKKHLDLLKKNEKIMKNYNIIQLLKTLSEEELEWFMNNMADGYEIFNGILLELNNPNANIVIAKT